MKIQPAVRLRRKEIRDEAKRILLGKVLFHPYFPHDIYINVSGIKEWLNSLTNSLTKIFGTSVGYIVYQTISLI